MTLILISLFLSLLYSALIIYYRISWKGIPNFSPAVPLAKETLPFVTIIIAARNEENNIGRCIQSIQSQSYPKDKFELIVVNDHSTDSTVEVIESFGKEGIRIINLADFTENKIINSYKKKAIDTALKFAQGDLIVTTDADCVVPKKWIETIVSFYVEKKVVFIAAPVIFKNHKKSKGVFNSFLQIFQSLDFMTLQGITGASVEKGFHNMCNGANLAYEKKVFFEVNGFEGIDEIASGDDMLLMHKIQKVYPNKIGFLKSPDA
ncbi:MAG: glycosyltransferase, partial [Ginsengibacter sp.]